MNAMYHKRNTFLWLPVLLALLWACRSDKKSADVSFGNTPLMVAFRDGQFVLSDSSKVAIPHWGDTTYNFFYCVRHAEQRKDQGDNPLLSPEGEARAKWLGTILKGLRLDGVATTSFKRATLTSELVRTEAGNVPAEAYPAGNQSAWLENKLSEGNGIHYLIVGHSNTVPQLLNQLKGDSIFQNIPEGDYGRFYIAVTRGIGQTEVLELRYEVTASQNPATPN